MSPLPFLGVLVNVFTYNILDRNSCKQTVFLLIRRHFLQHLNLDCTVCIRFQDKFPVEKELKLLVKAFHTVSIKLNENDIKTLVMKICLKIDSAKPESP